MAKKIFFIIFTIIIIILASLSLLLIYFDFHYKNKFYPRTKINNFNLSGQTKDEAKKILHQKLAKFNKGLKFKYKNYDKKINPEFLGTEINLEQTVDELYNQQRPNKKFKCSLNLLSNLIFGQKINLQYSIQPLKLNNFYQQELYPLGQSVKETSLIYHNNEFKTLSGLPGLYLNQEILTAKINKQIKNLDNSDINIPFKTVNPKISQNEIHSAKTNANKISSKNIKLTFSKDKKEWVVSPEILKSWISFQSKENPKHLLANTDYLKKDNFNLNKAIQSSLASKQNKEYDQELSAYFDRQKVGAYLKNNIAKNINQPPQNARLKMIDNKLEILVPAKVGQELLIDGNFENIIAKIKNQQNQIELLTKSRGADVNENNINKLGIKELLGSGESNFAGSPDNRIHNITTASERLNGILIKPGEEYSLVQNLGEVNEENGYKPELVIKENKTIPEYGGGLCQIATTNFRSAMNSGLPITERQSHSYSVQYYDPPGTDAAVYIPHPDLKFYNDTKNYLLLQTSISGTILTFELYGTKDGREVRFEDPEYWDKKPDKSFKAKWTQIIKYPDGHEKKSTFYSFYDNPDKYKHENNQ